MNRRQAGMSVAELLVALTLGMLVLLLAGSLLLSANAGYVSQTESAAVEDGGRYALETVARAVRQAALLNWDREDAGAGGYPHALAPIAGLDDHSLSKAEEIIANPIPGAENGSDVLALRFEGAGLDAAGDGSVVSCAGFGVGDPTDGWSIFYVAPNAQGDPELRCKYRGAGGWGADAIVGGVDSFQVLYGLDTDPAPDGQANQFVTASAVQRLDDALLLEAADPAARERELRRRTHWKRIVSIKVALMLHGQKKARTDSEPAVFDLFGRAYGDAAGSADRGTRLSEAAMPEPLRQRERMVFSTTIMLRNPAL